MAQAGFIPTDGYLVVVDFYVTDPKDPNKTSRARVPYASIKWLLDRLEEQGKSQDELKTMETGALAALSEKMLSNPQMQAPMPQQM